MSEERRFQAPKAYRAPDASPPRLLEYDVSDPPDELRPPPAPPKPRRWWIFVALLVAVPATYIGYRALSAPAAPPSQTSEGLPPLIPSTIGAAGPIEVFEPLEASEVAGAIGTPLPLTVRATGPDGSALREALVRFRVEAGDGTLVRDSARTNSDGLAESVVRLPETPGSLIVVAELVGSRFPAVRFDVSATPGPPARVEVVAGDGQTTSAGGLLPLRLGVRVTDQGGNPVPEAEVRFQVQTGEGLAAPSRTRTDSLGEASARWRLGALTGQQELVAIVSATQQQITFTAEARGTETDAGPEEPPPTPAGPVRVVPATFAVGGSHVCSLSGGAVTCRGGNDRGQVNGATATGLRAIATGISYACGLDSEGSATCWGANESGQLGDGSREDRAEPVGLAIDMHFSVLSAGASHTCGLVTGGYAACWGQNLSGQLGDGSREDRTAPRVIAGGRSFVSLAAGWNHTCGLSANGEVLCWGLNSNGQLGDGSRLDRLVPTRVGGPFRSVAAGSAHTCAITGDAVACWGDNAFGQLGDGTTEDRARPVPVVNLPAAPISVTVGAVHTCALVEGGAAYCWGQNLYGQVGDGTTDHRASPTPVAGDLAFTRLFAGGAVTCGLSAEQVEYCWGLNQNGQLGDGTRANRSRPSRAGG